MNQTGRVISSDNEHALVQIVRESACGQNCNKCGGTCSVMGVLISTPNSINAKKGDIVTIHSETNKIIRIAAIIYLIPLFFIVSGIILSKLLFFKNEISIFSDVFALIIGVTLYILCLFFIHLYSKKETIEYTISKKIS